MTHEREIGLDLWPGYNPRYGGTGMVTPKIGTAIREWMEWGYATTSVAEGVSVRGAAINTLNAFNYRRDGDPSQNWQTPDEIGEYVDCEEYALSNMALLRHRLTGIFQFTAPVAAGGEHAVCLVHEPEGYHIIADMKPAWNPVYPIQMLAGDAIVPRVVYWNDGTCTLFGQPVREEPVQAVRYTIPARPGAPHKPEVDVRPIHRWELLD